MDFSTFINSLPNVKQDTIDKIAAATCSSKTTVWRWLSGSVKVPPLKRKIIAEVLEKPEEELFPDYDKE